MHASADTRSPGSPPTLDDLCHRDEPLHHPVEGRALATWPHRLRAHPVALVAAALLLGLLVLAAALDWNWLRPAVERHLTSSSHRQVRIADLHLSLDRHLDLTIRLRGVRIENAPWADTREPMLVAGEAAFTMSAKSVWQKRPVVSMLTLVDAVVDLERQADGLRNWRLTDPDDRGPPRILVRALEARRTTIRFAHRGVDLDLRATSTPLAAPVAATQAGHLLTQRIVFDGRHGAAAFQGEAMTSDVLTFQETGRLFALRGHVSAGPSRFDADGVAADVFKATRLEGRVEMKGPSLATLRAFVHAPLPASPAYRIEAELRKDRSEYTFATLKARIGQSDLAGRLAYDLRDGRSSIEATLQSERAQWSDLTSLVGTGRSAALTRRSASDPALLNDRPLGFDRLKNLDAKLDLRIARLAMPDLPSLGALRFVATLDRGRLVVDDLDIALAGGHAGGALTLDARAELPAWQARMAWSDIRLDTLWPAQPDKKRVAGALHGRLELSGQGRSLAAMAGSASGRASAHLVDGSMSRLLDAELGLRPTKVVAGWLGRDRLTPLPCATVAFDFKQGRGDARRLRIETADSAITGSGSVDLGRQSLDLMLTPTPLRSSSWSLDKSIRIQGPLTGPRTSLVDRVDTAPSPSCSEARS